MTRIGFGLLIWALTIPVAVTGADVQTNRADASEVRLQHIRCTPVVFGKPEPTYIPLEDWPAEQIRQMFGDMEHDGINLILLSGGVGKDVYYPSKILKNKLSYDAYGRMFDLAKQHHMQVLLSGVIYTYHLQFQGKQRDAQADVAMNRRIFAELNERYGKRPGFWGWYIPHETGDRIHRGNIMPVLRQLPRFLKKLTPDKKVVFSPWFTSQLTVGPDATTPEQFAREWDAILSQVEGLDVAAIQDSTAPHDEIGKWFRAVAPVFRKHRVS